MTIHFKITNITCEACVKLSEGALKALPGVTTVKVEKDGSVAVESNKEISQEIIKNVLSEVDKTVKFT